jgi:hypothetical protein
MTSMFKTLTVLSVLATGAFAAQPAKADHVSIGIGIPVPTIRVVAPRVYVAPVYVPPVTTVYAAPSYSYTTSYYAPSYYPPTVVYSPPVVYSSPVYCPPTYYYSEPVVSTRLFLPLPSFGISFGFGGGHHGHR